MKAKRAPRYNTHCPPDPRRARLEVEALEGRLPPGDAFLGILLLPLTGPDGSLLPATESRMEPGQAGDGFEPSALAIAPAGLTRHPAEAGTAERVTTPGSTDLPEASREPFSSTPPTAAAPPLSPAPNPNNSEANALSRITLTAGAVAARDAFFGQQSARPNSPARAAEPALPTVLARPHSPAVSAPSARRPASAARLNQQPLSFEVNQGQTDARVRFLAHGPGYGLFLTATEAVVTLAPAPAAAPSGLNHESAAAPPGVVRMQILGANPDAQVIGQEPLPGKVNYLLGNDPARWHTNIATYRQVVYNQVYPGINLVYYGNQQQLEYDFRVAPGADPGVIALHFAGADRVGTNAQGDLLVQTGGLQFVEHRPVVYQEQNGVRTEVPSRFVVHGADVGFQLGAYDVHQPLVIDPVLSYSTYFGGSGLDWGNAVAVDQDGNLYLGGRVDVSPDFPLQNPVQPNPGGGTDGFVMKMTADGSSLVYSTYFGGRFADTVNGIAVDQAGDAYVTGVTASDNFPTVNALQPQNGGGFFGDAFVAKFTPDGSGLVFSTYLGGRSEDVGYDIAVDADGNACVTGATASRDFPTANALQPDLAGFSNAFVTKISADGSQLLFSTYLGGSGVDNDPTVGNHGHFGGIAVDADGNVYVTGSTTSDDFPTVNAVQPTLGGGRDAFVSKISADGSELLYSTYLGGSGDELTYGSSIAVDADGDAYVTGDTRSPDFPTANALQANLGRGGLSAFITELSPDGTALVFSTYFGGSNFEIGNDIGVDPWGNIYVVGDTGSHDLPTINAIQPAYGGGISDAFVAALAPSGTDLVYSTYLGGSTEDRGWGLAVDDSGSVYVTGKTDSVDFPTADAYQPSYGGGAYDAFLTKISMD